MEVDDDEAQPKPPNSIDTWEVHIKEEIVHGEELESLTVDLDQDANPKILAPKPSASFTTSVVPKQETLINLYHLGEQPVHSVFEDTPFYDPYEDAILQPTVMLKDWGAFLYNNPCYCSVCKILFPTINTLDQHKSHVHSLLVPCAPQNESVIMAKNCNGEQNMPIIYSQKCDHCNKYFPSKAAVLEHLYQLISLKQTVTNTINKINMNNSTPQQVTDISEDNSHFYRCPDCTYYFNTSDEVKHHIKHIHDKDCNNITLNPCKFKSQCVYCGDICEDVGIYNNHLKEAHMPYFSKKRHEATKRNESFKQILTDSEMKNKKLLSRKQQRFRCTVCKSEFNSYHSAYLHRRSMHRELKGRIILWCGESEKNGESSYYKCKWCAGIYNTLAGAKIHSKKKHPKSMPTLSKITKTVQKGSDASDKLTYSKYKCKICGGTFDTLMGARRHSKRLHPNKMYSCSKITKNVKQSMDTKTRQSTTGSETDYDVSKQNNVDCEEIRKKDEINHHFYQCAICKKSWKHKMGKHSCMVGKTTKCSMCGLLLSYTNVINHKNWHKKVGNQIKRNLIITTIYPNSCVLGETRSLQDGNGEVKAPSFDIEDTSKRDNVDESAFDKNLKFKSENILANNKSLSSPKGSSDTEISISDKEFVLYKCVACSILFTDKIVLENHSFSCKPRARSFSRGIKCDKCELVIHSSSQESHEKLHAMYLLTSKNFKIKTVKILKYINSDNDLSNKDHEYRNIFKCESCDLCFMKSYTLDFHCKNRGHKVSIIRKCDECGLNFTLISLNMHQRIQHKKLKFSFSDFCIRNEHGVIIKDVTKIEKENERTDDKKGMQNCGEQNQCSNAIVTKDRIDSIGSESSKDPMVTNMKFRNKILYKCTDCNICFMSQLAMENHRYMKPFKLKRKIVNCNICNLKFSLNSYTMHKKTHHDLMKLKKDSFTVKHFGHRQSPHNHILYKCEKCDLCFMIPSSAENHENHSHIKDIVSCTKCRLQFTSYDHKKHYKYHHEKLSLSFQDFHVEIVNNENLEKLNLIENNVEFENKKMCGQLKITKTCDGSHEEKSKTDNISHISESDSSSEECSIPENFAKQETKDVIEQLSTSILSDDESNTNVIKTDWNYIGPKNISKLFKCSKCDIFFLNYLSLQNHVYRRKHLFVNNPVTCEDCGLMFLPLTYPRHFSLHHSKKQKYNLEDFDIKIDTKCFYIKELSKITNNRDTCENTNVQITTENYVQCQLTEISDKHLKDTQICGNNKNTTPNFCGISAQQYKKYLQTATVLYKCDYCNVHFLNLLTFRSHLAVYHPNNSSTNSALSRITTCTECGLKFSKKSYKHHKQIHHLNMGLSLKDFEIRTKSDATTSNLIVSSEEAMNKTNSDNTITNETSTNNTFTNETTTNKKSMIKTYSRKKYGNQINWLYRCNDCNLHFLKSQSLQQHLDTNHSALSVTTNCLICGLKFSSVSLKIHETIHHENLDISTEDFYIIDSLEKQETIIAKTKSNYKCEYCEKQFALQMALKMHLKSHHMDSSTEDLEIKIPGTNDNQKFVQKCTDVSPGTSKKSIDFIQFEPMDDLRSVLPNDTENNGHAASKDKANKGDSKLHEIFCAQPNAINHQNAPDDLAMNKVSFESQEENQTEPKIKFYKCGHCDVYFIDKVLCITHMTDHVPYSFKDYIECKVCNLQFPISIFAQHMYKNHNNDFDLENVWITEYRVNNESKRPVVVDAYYAISRVESTAVSTTTNLDQKDNN